MDTVFEKQLREAIGLARDMKVQLVTQTKLDHEDYMHSLGYLEALRRVEQMMEEIRARED